MWFAFQISKTFASCSVVFWHFYLVSIIIVGILYFVPSLVYAILSCQFGDKDSDLALGGEGLLIKDEDCDEIHRNTMQKSMDYIITNIVDILDSSHRFFDIICEFICHS